ncbi:hypothetical protein ABEB36_014669 [Hypothenemus hampei]|uniref:Translocation protein SEC62 n=1 Tax=Hypothenemus hampei TaxID=57062 RepID=A0ABD1E3F0_HYPHA
MAEKRRSRKRKDEYAAPGEKSVNVPSKEEYSVANWMRKNIPIKRTKFLNHNVEYFTGKRAVDALLDSKFSKGDTALFTSREEIIDYLHLMLEHRLFHRAKKVPVSEEELKSKKKVKKEKSESEDEQKPQQEQNKGTDGESSVVEGKDPNEKSQKEKKKKKIRLEMHNDQRFVDSLDAYVWIYDPIPFHYWIIGALLVVGAIGICMFPLWPPIVRLGVYYISVAAACFLVSIILMAVLRLILFCLIWLVTFGKHHLWILPNLTEDVGFFASFWPLYKYEYRGPGALADKKKGKRKKSKNSDVEDDDEDNKSQKSSDEERRDIQDVVNDQESEEKGQEGGSESESESKSSTGRDFEILDHEELDDHEKEAQ